MTTLEKVLVFLLVLALVSIFGLLVANSTKKKKIKSLTPHQPGTILNNTIFVSFDAKLFVEEGCYYTLLDVLDRFFESPIARLNDFYTEPFGVALPLALLELENGKPYVKDLHGNVYLLEMKEKLPEEVIVSLGGNQTGEKNNNRIS